MTYEAVKEKLYWYIEHADQNKVMAIYTLLNEEIESGSEYDEATLKELERRRDDMLSGKAKTYTFEEIKESLTQHRKKHGI